MKNNFRFNFISVLSLLLIFSSTALASSGGDEGSGTVLKVGIAITAFLVAIVFWLVLVYAESNDVHGEKVITPFKTSSILLHNLFPCKKKMI